MKLLHLSDLHLGKRFNDVPLLDDQKYILDEILRIVDEEAPDGILIAGDVYDKSLPSAEAVTLCDWFLVELARRKQQVFLSSGNHDSADRLAFGRLLMDGSGIHIAPAYHGDITCLTLTDAHGPVHIYMLPFVKPATVRHFFSEAQVESYTDAVRVALTAIRPDPSARNVLMAHQYVAGAQISDSEDHPIGGLECVAADVFDGFDYVALGHLHGPQQVTRPQIRYCGTPLKYSFSELRHHKSVTVVELGQKGQVAIRTVPLTPLRELVELKGTFAQLVDRAFAAPYRDCFVGLTLTDEEEIPDLVAQLYQVYPYMLKWGYDNARTRSSQLVTNVDTGKEKQPLEAFGELYLQQNGQEMTREQQTFLTHLIEEIWEV